MRPAPLLVNQHLVGLLCPIRQPPRTSHLRAPSNPFSIVDPGTMVPFSGLWVNVGIVMSANDAMVNTPLPTAPFEPTRGLSPPGPSLHPGVNNMVALQVAAPSCVNSVNSSLTVPCSTFAFIDVDSQQKIGLPQISCSFNDSCSSALALSLHQPLLPAEKVSPIRVEKLHQEVLTHPDHSFVTCLGWSWGWVSCWFQPCFGLLKIGHTEYALR